MGCAGATVSQAKEVSPAGGWIGIRLSPVRYGLGKGPLTETRPLCRKNGVDRPIRSLAHGGMKVVIGTPSMARMNSGVTRLML